MKTKLKLPTFILLLCPLFLSAQNYEQSGDSLFAIGQYDKAVKKFTAAIEVNGETPSLKQKKSNAVKCINLLSKAKKSEDSAEYKETIRFYSDLYNIHALTTYQDKISSLKVILARKKREQEIIAQKQREQEILAQKQREKQKKLASIITINKYGNKIVFSNGNLQYQPSTDKWRFAEHQYDIIGNGNKDIFDAYAGWIDLFGWGTGSNPTLSSTNYKDYVYFTDWGINIISNSNENKANKWRTLTNDEWRYMLEFRTNANILRAIAIVNGIKGYIILPDNWSAPKGLPQFNPSNKKWSDNSYSVSEWEQMEQNGATFLPAAGCRYGRDVNDVGDDGYYWSCTTYDDSASRSWYFFFNSDGTYMYNSYCYYGMSVRLVQDVD